MNLIIKILKDKEISIECEPENTVLELKKLIEKSRPDLPCCHQKLILAGRALVNENKISSYPSIQNDTKLTLILRKPDPLKEVITRCFRRFYNEQLSDRLANEFMLDYEKKIKQMSLDDIERFAINLSKEL